MNANVVKAIGLAFLVFLYLISPLDIIPDIAPPITWLDDGGVLYLGGKKIVGWLSGGEAQKAA